MLFVRMSIKRNGKHFFKTNYEKLKLLKWNSYPILNPFVFEFLLKDMFVEMKQKDTI